MDRLNQNSIYHEKQEGSLCGQHCLNNLLQDSYFTAIDLANHAEELDTIEKSYGVQNGRKGASQNVDDSGFFSIQVLNKALMVWNLDMIPLNSTNSFAQAAKSDVNVVQAYICNYQQHWFCIRKIAQYWFNLNSMLSSPQHLTSTYLSLYLAQLQHEGYSIFIINGSLPICKAERELHETISKITQKPLSKEEVRNKRSLFLDKLENKSNGT